MWLLSNYMDMYKMCLCLMYMLRIYPRLAGTRVDYAWGGTLAVTAGNTLTAGAIQTFTQGTSLTVAAGAVLSLAGRPNPAISAVNGVLFDGFHAPDPSGRALGRSSHPGRCMAQILLPDGSRR